MKRQDDRILAMDRRHQPESSQSPPCQTSEIVGAETLMESIQNCHMSMEESRRRLVPLLKFLEEDDHDNVLNSNGTGHGKQQQPSLKDITDGQIAQEFIHCTEGTFASIDMLMIRLADSGLICIDSPQNENKSNGQRHPPSHSNNHLDGNNGDDQNVYLLMASNCIAKGLEFVTHNFLKLAEADSVSSLNNGSGPFDDATNNNFEERGDAEEGEFKIQPCMARLAELALRMIHVQTLFPPSCCPDSPSIPNVIHDDESDDEDAGETIITSSTIAHAYAQYQRRCLRTRSKHVISSLVELRRVAESQKCFVSDILEEDRRRQQLELRGGGDLDEEGDDNGAGGMGGDGADGGGTAPREQPHAQAVTVILGEASSLIQPLAAWRDAISPHTAHNKNDITFLLKDMCQEAMDTLDNEAQALSVTVGSWFGSDQRGISSLEQENSNGGNNSQEAVDLLSMEAALEEMAFLCQVLSRYCVFSQQTVVRDNAATQDRNKDSKLQNLLTEQSLHYSTLETQLATLQFTQALSLASPQLIELGRKNLKVPSIVEDAHFLCVRAIERAAGTRSERAVWTVGHWVCETWGVDESGGIGGGGGGVYRALMEGVGCSGGDSCEVKDHQSGDAMGGARSEVENSFTAALLEAVDDDMGHGEGGGGKYTESGPPASGGVSSALWEKIGVGGKFGENQESVLQNRIDTELCALNGIFAAGNACSALSGLFAELVEERLEDEATANSGNVNSNKSSMLSFARDELASHSRSYNHLIHQRVRVLITEWCGAEDTFDCEGRLCLQNLRLFIESEIYNLDASSFRSAEGEDRLEVEMIGPIRRSQIFREIGEDKCDAAVILQMAEAMSWKSTEIILQILFQGDKDFNDWGAMLLSKQVRMLQNVYCGLALGSSTSKTGPTNINTATILQQFERINQAVSILQLEKPSDWLVFAYKIGESNDTNLTVDEIRKVMSLRVDFSEDAIVKVCSQIKSS